MLKEGYTPFPVQTRLTRNQNIISCYVNPHGNLYWLQTLQQLMDKKNGDTGNHQNLPPTRRVGYLYSFQGCLLPYTRTGTVQEISEISCQGLDIPVQGTAIRFVHSTHGVHCSRKEVRLMAIHKGIRIHQYLDDWLVRATSHQVCLQHTQDLVKICQELGWLVNLGKSELEPSRSSTL